MVSKLGVWKANNYKLVTWITYFNFQLVKYKKKSLGSFETVAHALNFCKRIQF